MRENEPRFVAFAEVKLEPAGIFKPVETNHGRDGRNERVNNLEPFDFVLKFFQLGQVFDHSRVAVHVLEEEIVHQIEPSVPFPAFGSFSGTHEMSNGAPTAGKLCKPNLLENTNQHLLITAGKQTFSASN